MAFKAFLKSEFCEENIEFWLACEQFKEEKKTKEILASAAVDIYEQFIKTNSPKQVCTKSARIYFQYNVIICYLSLKEQVGSK